MGSTVVPWSSGLFHCFSDVPNCCLTCCCPCITFGRISEIVDQGSSSCCGKGAVYAVIGIVSAAFTGINCAFMYSHSYRTKMRKQYSLEDGASACHDCLLHCVCEPCALCQEHRELKARGFDMSLGWEGNMKKKGEEGMVPAGVEGGMTRDCTVPLMSDD